MTRQRKMTPERKAFIDSLLAHYQPTDANDVQEMLKDLLGDTLQGMLEAEMDQKLGYSKYDYQNKTTDDSRNGYSKKTVTSSMGPIDLDIPRDRKGEFEPQIVKKNQTDISNIEDQVLSMYAKGMTTRDISSHLRDVYGVDASAEMISHMTDRILPIAKEWQNRPLERKYAIVFMDAVHFNVREDNRTIKKAVYVAIGVKLNGTREVLGMWIGGNESAKYWLGVLNELKNRGVQDILILCADGLSGIKESIAAAYPNTEYQRCIVHQVRNTLKYVSEKDKKAFANDLKSIYHAPNEEAGYERMHEVTKKWHDKYPNSMKRWEENWDVISPMFKFSADVRKVMYTTNAIESLNSALRRLNSQRSVFPSDTALLKALYLATFEATKKWIMPLRNWGKVYGELSIMYEGRLG